MFKEKEGRAEKTEHIHSTKKHENHENYESHAHWNSDTVT